MKAATIASATDRRAGAAMHRPKPAHRRQARQANAPLMKRAVTAPASRASTAPSSNPSRRAKANSAATAARKGERPDRREGRPDWKGGRPDGKGPDRGKGGGKPAFQPKPREERPARFDPDSPFAKLAALRDQLKK